MNVNTTNEETWLTPPEILSPLGEFDLDPCTPEVMPWPTAKKRYTKQDDGLLQPWEGRVWLNPPYGRGIGRWMEKMAMHMNGIALTFARTDTDFFQDYVFESCYSILFVKRRINFLSPEGDKKWNAPAPSVLISYSESDAEALDQSGIRGRHKPMRPEVIMIGFDGRTWKIIVGQAISVVGKVQEDKTAIYAAVCNLAPARVKKNRHYKEKVRQIIYTYYDQRH